MAVTFRSSGVEVVVPATSANLGPGFDSLGLALGLHDHLVAMVTEDPGVLVHVEGEGAGLLPTDEHHLVARAMAATWSAMDVEPPGVIIRCVNAIPQGRGMGSSAAAIIAGIMLARGLVVDGDDLLPDDEVLGLATRMEGHPDNVAAALLGGFTTAWVDSDEEGAPHASAVTHAVHADVVPVVCVPQQPMATSTARGMLNDQIDRADAVFNIGRVALLTHALTEAPHLLFPATEDRLHQHARASAYPASLELVIRLRGRGLPAVISGAGPTVLALTTSPADVADVLAQVPEGWQASALAIDSAGARVHIRGV